MEKASLRKYIKTQKQLLTIQQKEAEAAVVFEAIENMPCFQSAKCVLMFYSMPDELPTHHFVEKWAKHKSVLLPRVNGDVLEVAEYGHLARCGKYEIDEPTSPAVSPAVVDLVIVPAIALDRSGNRLGRGKGYYDRLLPQCTKAYKIGVGLNCQLVEAIPVEPTDYPLDAVITASECKIINPYKNDI